MALSNIGNEPHRELTEQLMGAVIVIPIIIVFGILCDYIGTWMYEAASDPVELPWAIAVFLLAPIAVILGTFVGWIFLLIMHRIGEDVCDSLQRRGVHLRPRNRI